MKVTAYARACLRSVMSSKGDMMETLCWGWQEMPRSLIFEKLLEIANPVVERFRSDLYYDAKWLSDLPDESTVFYYTVRDYGTHIFPTNDFKIEKGTTYRITITRSDDNRWDFGAEKV